MSKKLRKNNEETYEKIQDGFKGSKKVEVIHPTGKRRFNSTIDEKIDALIEWHKNYPDIKVERKHKGKPISDKTIEKLKELAQNEGIEFSEIEDRYKKIQSYNEYVRYRDIQGKLSDEEKKKCKEGNLGGRFGYPTEIEEIAGKLKIDVKQVADIITQYGSVDNFIQMYRNGKLSIDENTLYNQNLINNMIDMDYNPFAENYSKLVQVSFGEKLAEPELMLFSSNSIDKVLETLTPREMECIKLRFGLVDGEQKKLEDVGQELNVTRERGRQIEAKALRKLRHPSRAKLIYIIKIDDLKKNEYITHQERTVLTDLENDMYNSNLIFKHDSIDDIDFDKDRFVVIRDIQEEIKTRIKKEKEQKVQNIAKNDIAIEEVDFSIKTFISLKRFGINTISQLAFLSKGDLCQIRGLGTRGLKEVTSKLEKYGIKLPEENETKEEFDLGKLGFTEDINSTLLLLGIRTVEDLLNTSDRMLEEKLLYHINEGEVSFHTVQKVIEKRHELIKEYGFEEKRDFNANTSIIELEEISRRTIHSLNYAGIFNVGDLLRLSEEELVQVYRIGPKGIEEILKVRASFNSGAGLDDPDSVETTEGETVEKVYSDSEMEEIKAKKTELELELKALNNQIGKARELLAEYNKLIGDDKVKTDDEAPDFKDE